MKRYSILINSCDAYSDIWPFFFHVLKETWKGEMPKLYLNTESAQYCSEELDVQVLNIVPGKAQTIPWGERLLDCLERIGSDYVLMMLEDFLYEKPINIEIIDNCFFSMSRNTSIAAYQFIHASEGVENLSEKEHDICDGFGRRKRFGKFKIVAGPTLWRKKDLIRLTKASDSPWEWEYFGNYRTYFFQQCFYSIRDPNLDVFVYDVTHGGAIHRGKWVGYKVKELIDKYNYDLEFGIREVEEDWTKLPKYQKVEPRHKRLTSILKNRAKIFSNLLYGLFIRCTDENYAE